ncbi:hypothetical protein ONZ27_001460 [Salmonella enterica subsp. enterica serovar Chandans]|nr:hypothetical protein [Salmonella enterica]EID6454365.1 hypothetical protein [Salmonella enterica]EIE2770135.1 hypothetical protein [Salmonella enterica subsp. enterica serovar Rubislaw]EKB3329111.1 hypothetical protein [Salmonella enterica subsp. enterica serovar Chandans]ELU4731053.1 hypothetical protein [Salmonella enterica]
MTEVDEFDLAVIRDFIGQCCTDFVAFNEDRSDDGIASTEPSVAKTDRRFFPLYTQEENPYDNADTTPRYRR